MTDETITEDAVTVPKKKPRPALRRADSLVLVNTGHGKGKSTAAFGVLMRALAAGWSCGVVQYIKSGRWKTGEEAMARKMGADWWAMGDGFSWLSEDLEESERLALAAWHSTKEMLADGSHRLLILDEITYPMNWGWIDVDEVVTAITARNPTTTVICTGRDAPQPLVDLADTVTEMKEIKHAYKAGIRAERGIDF